MVKGNQSNAFVLPKITKRKNLLQFDQNQTVVPEKANQILNYPNSASIILLITPSISALTLSSSRVCTKHFLFGSFHSASRSIVLAKSYRDHPISIGRMVMVIAVIPLLFRILVSILARILTIFGESAQVKAYGGFLGTPVSVVIQVIPFQEVFQPFIRKIDLG